MTHYIDRTYFACRAQPPEWKLQLELAVSLPKDWRGEGAGVGRAPLACWECCRGGAGVGVSPHPSPEQHSGLGARHKVYCCRAAAGLFPARFRKGELKNGWRNWRVAKNCREVQREAERSEVRRCRALQPQQGWSSPAKAASPCWWHRYPLLVWSGDGIWLVPLLRWLWVSAKGCRGCASGFRGAPGGTSPVPALRIDPAGALEHISRGSRRTEWCGVTASRRSSRGAYRSEEPRRALSRAEGDLAWCVGESRGCELSDSKRAPCGYASVFQPAGGC